MPVILLLLAQANKAEQSTLEFTRVTEEISSSSGKLYCISLALFLSPYKVIISTDSIYFVNWPLKSEKYHFKSHSVSKLQQIVTVMIDSLQTAARAERAERGARMKRKSFFTRISWDDYQFFGIHFFGCKCCRWRRRRRKGKF